MALSTTPLVIIPVSLCASLITGMELMLNRVIISAAASIGSDSSISITGEDMILPALTLSPTIWFKRVMSLSWTCMRVNSRMDADAAVW